MSSPTYTARYPFGTPIDFEDDDLLMILGKRKPIVVVCVEKKRLDLYIEKTQVFELQMRVGM
jgi:hypothetical protein